ncbi:MAG: segregation and condensation protein A [Gammaproteobacteria bacterium]|nr:segregation and condensation protein A [Gammaproteobacteria bacterium]
MTEQDFSKEERILSMVKRVLTDVAKETFAKPGHVHPLSDDTIHSMRDCLGLIAARQAELQEEAGRPSTSRPRYVDEPRDSVVVPISEIKKRGDDS